MNSRLNEHLAAGPENQAVGQNALAGTSGKANRIIIVIEDGRVIKYIQKTVNKTAPT